MTRAKVSGIAFSAVTLAAGLAVGVGAALTLAIPTTPAVLSPADGPLTVPVTMQGFSDPQPVEVVVRISPPVPVNTGRAGTVTAWGCAPGTVLESGKSAVAIDGVNLITLATSVPPWRDLSVGTEGADVAAVQEELRRLGYAAHSDGVFSRADLAAAVELGKSVGTRVTDTLARDLLVWIPSSTVQIETCEVGLGSTTASGQSLARATSNLVVEPVALPTARLPGPRTLEAFAEPVALGEGGELPTGLSNAAVRDSPAFREASASADDASTVIVKGKLVLTEPVSVAAVPATSVLVLDSEAACVFADAQAFPVKIVGSEFGNSFVTFVGDEQPASVWSFVPQGEESCS